MTVPGEVVFESEFERDSIKKTGGTPRHITRWEIATAFLAGIPSNLLFSILFGLLTASAGRAAEPGEELSGGSGTVFQTGKNSFPLPLANISRENRRAHVVGNSFFNKNWVIAPASTAARDGLGPIFHTHSCSGCHVHDGRGTPEISSPGLLFRLSLPGRNLQGGPLPDPVFGNQLGIDAVPGVEPEGRVEIQYEEMPGSFRDGTPFFLRRPTYKIVANPLYGTLSGEVQFSPRIAPPVFGLGLLEAVDIGTIRAFADPEDRDQDGISGRLNSVWNLATGTTEPGRFGWKANQPTLRQQIAAAFSGDIGITSHLLPDEALTESQKKIIKYRSGGSPELEDDIFDRILTYQRTLAPPARRNQDDPFVIRGRQLFHDAKCASCHIPQMRTGPEFPGIEELANQVIHPFTDLLLHDMGEGLSDGRPDFEADGREWRTPPLWGIGLVEEVNGHSFFLHDGRARGFTEAILWHGGEAEASKEAFRGMSEPERNRLIAFLGSL